MNKLSRAAAALFLPIALIGLFFAQARAGSGPAGASSGLFGNPDTDVTQAYAFPVPFRPNSGNPVRFGSWAVGIQFVNLPSGGTINLYSLSGKRVRSIGIIAPQMAWDACNSDGQQVASGLYIWEVLSGGNSKTGKLVIIK